MVTQMIVGKKHYRISSSYINRTCQGISHSAATGRIKKLMVPTNDPNKAISKNTITTTDDGKVHFQCAIAIQVIALFSDGME